MKTTVDLKKETGKPYTWEGLPCSWESAEAAKTWKTANSNAYTMSIGEGFSISDKPLKKVTASKFEKFSIGDKISKQTIKINKEQIQITEEYRDLIHFVLKFMEAFSFTEKPFKNITILQNENLKIAETGQPKKITSVLKEKISIAESQKNSINFILKFYETILIDESIFKHTTVKKFETLHLDDSLKKAVEVLKNEGFKISEHFKSINDFRRAFLESVRIAENFSKKYNLTINESLAIIDVYLKSANAVLSDISLNSGELDLEEFLANTAAPLGYEPFRNFIAGDIEYHEALIKLIVEAGVTTDRPNVSEWDMNIDLPDVIDRGQVELTESGARINFERDFFAPPEVTATIKGGATIGIPTISDVDNKGFTVILKDINDKAISGRISWSAVGY